MTLYGPCRRHTVYIHLNLVIGVFNMTFFGFFCISVYLSSLMMYAYIDKNEPSTQPQCMCNPLSTFLLH